MVRTVSLLVLTVLMVFLGITFYRVVAPFLLPLFLAVILAVLCRPVCRFFLKRKRNRPRLSAGLTTGMVIAALLIPLLIGIFAASVELVNIAQDTFGEDIFGEDIFGDGSGSIGVYGGARSLRIQRLADQIVERSRLPRGGADSSRQTVPDARPIAAMRRLVTIFWHMLTHNEGYQIGGPPRLRLKKTRRREAAMSR